MDNDIVTVFCKIDDFCQEYEAEMNRKLLTEGKRKRVRASGLTISEMMTIVVLFQTSGYRTFKDYYLRQIQTGMRKEFPGAVSYNRFIELMPRITLPLSAYLMSLRGRCTGISFIDATSIAVCHNRRIKQHKVFKDVAKRGKTSVGWFYGFKLHLVINDQGQLLGLKLTSGNVDDRVPVKQICQSVVGKLYGDRGYISKELFKVLLEEGIQLITRLKSNMKNKLVPMFDKLMLRKRAIIESVNDQLKNICQIEHTRHRSVCNFLINVVAGLIAYCHKPNKPSLNLNIEGLSGLPTLVI
jgi:Transposase DDE domain